MKRYLQNAHPDRLLDPLERDPSQPDGFRPVSWDHALDRTVAEIRRIQAAHGNDAFAMLSGVSLDNEKSYLIGKFARLALGTANLDYNGRLCMVSAGVANKRALGIDRASNPWSDIPLAEVVFVIGANIAECAPITTSWIWRARDNGAKLIVADPRVTPTARTADLFLGLRPGYRLGAARSDAARADRARLARPRLHPRPHERLRRGGRGGPRPHAGVGRGDHRRARGRGSSRRPSGGGRRPPGCCCTPAASSTTPRASRTCGPCINLGLATGKYGKPGSGVTTITGQGNGQGGREHGHKCDQLPGNRDITNPEHRAYIASVWGCDVDEIPGKGLTAQEIVEAIHRGEIKGLLSICFNPVVSLPDTTFTKEALDKLEFYAVIDFFLSETAFHADLVLPGSLHEEDEGTSTSVEGRVIKLNPSKTPARQRPPRLGDPLRHRPPPRQGPLLPVHERRGDLRGAAGRVQGRQRRLLRHHLGPRRAASSASSGPARPRTIPAPSASSKAAASTPTTAAAGSTRSATGRRRRSSTTSTRSGSPPAGS